jgi:broad specificity phosphatase PhoE
MDSEMEIYLLRHGVSTANEKRLVCGAADYPMSALGESQAKQVCRFLSDISFTHIYTSPLSRARKTLEHLVGSVPIVVEPDLVELNTGDVSHITLDELWARDQRYRQPWLTPALHYPGGESMNDMLARIGGWYEQKSREWRDSDIVLIVGHEGTLRVILHKLLKLEVSEYPAFPIGNCDHLHIKIDREQALTYCLVPLTSLDQ